MIILEGQWITKLADLSGKFRNLVGQMPGGAAWMQWAMAEPELVMAAPNEPELLTRVVSGLSTRPLLTIEALDLSAHPQRLMRLDGATVKTMVRAAESKEEPEIQEALDLLSKDGVNNFAALASGHNFLKDRGVDGNSLFQVMELDDLAALALLDEIDAGPEKPAGLRRAAAHWAVSRVQSCAGFIDAYLFLRHSIRYSKHKTRTDRIADVTRYWDRLIPLVNPMLETMSVGAVDSDEELQVNLETALYNGRPLGFATRARALRVLCPHVGVKAEDEAWMHAARETVMDARCLVRQGNLIGISMSQGGNLIRLDYLSDKRSLTLECGPGGLVTIADFSGRRARSGQSATP